MVPNPEKVDFRFLIVKRRRRRGWEDERYMSAQRKSGKKRLGLPLARTAPPLTRSKRCLLLPGMMGPKRIQQMFPLLATTHNAMRTTLIRLSEGSINIVLSSQNER